MWWGLVAFMFLVHAGIGAVMAFALRSLGQRQWWLGISRVFLALGALGLAWALGPLGLLVVDASVPPLEGSDLVSRKAFLLGKAMAAQMNAAVIGLPVGLVLGGVAAWRRRRFEKP
jgi:hypothetical protein